MPSIARSKGASLSSFPHPRQRHTLDKWTSCPASEGRHVTRVNRKSTRLYAAFQGRVFVPRRKRRSSLNFTSARAAQRYDSRLHRPRCVAAPVSNIKGVAQRLSATILFMLRAACSRPTKQTAKPACNNMAHEKENGRVLN